VADNHFFVCAVFRVMVETVYRLFCEVPGEGAVYDWGRNRLEGNSCRRRLKLVAGLGGGTGQAQGLPLPDRLGGILLARHVAGEE